MEDQSFWQQNEDVIGAVITLAITFLVAYVVDRFVLARAGRVADRVTEAGVSRAARTRLRVVRRLIFVVIVLIGCFLALNQFTKLDRLATGLLASSAVLGIVLGLAHYRSWPTRSRGSSWPSPSRSGSATRSRSTTRPAASTT